MGQTKISLSKMLKYLALLFVAATVFGEPEAEAVADPAADPSADPYYLTYGLGHYGYAGYYGYPYGYGYWGRKRRSADPEADPIRYRGFYGRKRRSAEPEAEATADPKADPYLLYGGYYGHGYGLGYYGYPYGGYYLGK